MNKTCTKCGESKPLDCFHKRNDRKSGYSSHCKDCKKKYRIDNNDHFKELHSIYYEKNKDFITEKARINYKENMDHRKLKMKNSRIKLKEKVFDRLGNKCVRCGFSDIRALQIDHINGNGINDRKGIGWWTFCNNLLKMSDEELFGKYQVLCANCNQIKRIELGESRKR